MSPSGVRLKRLLDLVLLVLASSGLFLALFFLAGQIWFTQLFQIALKGKTPLAAAICGVVALLAGCSYVFLPPPCQPDRNGGIRNRVREETPASPRIRGRNEEDEP